MLKAIITYLNLKLDLLNYFDLTRCLVELKESETDNGTLKQPVEYISNGEFDVINFDEFNGVSYWRLRDEPSTERTETQKYRAGAKNNIETTIPLRLVFAVPRTKLTEDDAYSFDRIRQTMVKQFAIDDEVLKNQLGAISVRITQVGSNSKAKDVWEEETEGTGTFEPKYETVFGSIDVDVVIVSDHECLPTECDDVESDILRAFDWCGNTSVTVGRLTQDQQDCISAYICGVADPVQIQVNGVNTETAEAGTTYDQEIHNSVGTDVGTAANPSIVGDSTVTVNSSAFDSVVAEGTIDVPVQYENGTPVGTITGGVVEIPDPVSCPSVSLSLSDTTPDFGDTITLTATPSNITPTTYFFFAWRQDTDEFEFLQESASNTYDWEVDVTNVWDIHVIANDGTDFVSDCQEVTITPDSDAEAWLDAVGIPDDSTVYFSGTIQETTGAKYWYYVNRLVYGLKSDSVWSEGHYMYLFIGGAASIHKINLLDPQDTDGAFRLDFNGGWTHDKEGLTANGTNTYADAHFNPNTHLAANDGAFVVYKRTQPTGTSVSVEVGAYDGVSGFGWFGAKGTSNRSFYGVGPSKVVIGIGITDLDGCHIITRDNNANLQKWFGKDGTLQDSDATAFTNHPDYVEYIGARNSSGTANLYLENGAVLATVGRFNGLSDAQAASLRTRIETFMESLNLNV